MDRKCTGNVLSFYYHFQKALLYFIYNSDPDGAPNLAEAKRLAAIESNVSSGWFSILFSSLIG